MLSPCTLKARLVPPEKHNPSILLCQSLPFADAEGLVAYGSLFTRALERKRALEYQAFKVTNLTGDRAGSRTWFQIICLLATTA